jgi:Flp pilus assembly protein TadD
VPESPHISGKTPAPSDAALASEVHRPWAERRFGVVLAIICLIGVMCRAIILADYLRHNPSAVAPVVDARTYWDWAERIARGQIIQKVPFFSAPLYPYTLGLLRAFGGTLGLVYGLQMLADLVTACVLAYAARLRFGALTGLLSAGLFLLLQEPASFSLRILTCSLQLLLLAIVYLQLVRVQNHPTLRRFILLGIALGLLCLSYPPAMVLAVAVVPWLFWQSGRHARDVARAVLPLGISALLIAPATLHNWHASGNLFFIQSVTGVNLLQGNQPDSNGGYTPIPNTTTGREQLFDDVARQYAQATGHPGSWADIDRYYRQQVFDFWRSDWGRAGRLALRKAYMFLTFRDYADIYQSAPEITHGLNTWLRLTPLQVPWLIGPALLGLALLLRRPVKYAPEWLMFLIPFAIVVVHWYTPRYRLPAIPIIVVCAAWVIGRALAWRAEWHVAVPATALLALGIVLGPINHRAGLDLPDPTNAFFVCASGLAEQGKSKEAIEMWRKGLQVKPSDAVARVTLGDYLTGLGRTAEALPEYEQAWQYQRNDPTIPVRIGRLLFQQRQYAAAERVLARAVNDFPADATLLGMLADTKKALGENERACELFLKTLRMTPDDDRVRAAYAELLGRMRRWEDARAEYARLVADAPEDFELLRRLGIVEVEVGQLDAAVATLERAVALRPTDAGALHDLGAAYLKQNRLDEAADCFRRAIAANPAQEKSRLALQHVEQLRAERATSAPSSP